MCALQSASTCRISDLWVQSVAFYPYGCHPKIELKQNNKTQNKTTKEQQQDIVQGYQCSFCGQLGRKREIKLCYFFSDICIMKFCRSN